MTQSNTRPLFSPAPARSSHRFSAPRLFNSPLFKSPLFNSTLFKPLLFESSLSTGRSKPTITAVNNVPNQAQCHRHTLSYSVFLKSLSLLAASLLLSIPSYAATIFINEFHYDNSGSDVDEGLEIVGPSGATLDDWQLLFYNGGDGSVYRTVNLGGVFLDQSAGYGALSFLTPGIQNGPADAFALVNPLGELIEFISYEGSVTASDGAASGRSSEDVGILESSSTPIGQSIQRIGSGVEASEFTWSIASASFGEINFGQTINGSGTPVPLPATSGLLAVALMTLVRLKNRR